MSHTPMYQKEKTIINDIPKRNKTITLKKLQENVTNLDKLEQIEIFRIIQKYDNRLTENKNGIFINLSNLSEECIEEISGFVSYSLDNKKRLSKIEMMSQSIFKNSILNQQYKEYKNNMNLKNTENKISDNPIKDILSDNKMLLNTFSKNKEKDVTTLNSLLNIEDIIDIDENDENEEMKNTQLNQIREETVSTNLNNPIETIKIDSLSKKNKFTGKRGRLYKKCRELNKSYQGNTLISFGTFNNDIGDIDILDDGEEDVNTPINELTEEKI